MHLAGVPTFKKIILTIFTKILLVSISFFSSLMMDYPLLCKIHYFDKKLTNIMTIFKHLVEYVFNKLLVCQEQLAQMVERSLRKILSVGTRVRFSAQDFSDVELTSINV